MALRGPTISKLLLNPKQIFVYGKTGLKNDAEDREIREKAQRKIAEMRKVVLDMTQHNEQCIKRRKELQRTTENYLKALEESGKSISDSINSKDYKDAAAKIAKMRSLVHEFAHQNQEGIRRRMMMQGHALEYIRALDEYKVRLQKVDP